MWSGPALSVAEGTTPAPTERYYCGDDKCQTNKQLVRT
jgi:hypothetical protein